ncbi:hypothetical protein Gpo141_00014818, partial [Globisporangium polare]
PQIFSCCVLSGGCGEQVDTACVEKLRASRTRTSRSSRPSLADESLRETLSEYENFVYQ